MQSSWHIVLVSIAASVADVPELDSGEESFPLFDFPALKLKASIETAPGLDDVEVTVLDYYSTDSDDLAARILALKPDIVGASCYVWSLPTLAEAARKVKSARPDVWVVFGGPSARPEMLNLGPWLEYQQCIDAVATGEGEQVIREIAWARKRGDRALGELPGLSTWRNGAWQKIPQITIEDLEAYGSVYQQNLAAGRRFAFIQTYRGCPLSCSFCQWGQMIDSARRVYSKEYLVDEFQAMKEGAPQSGFLIDVALNLNIRAFRNMVAAEAEVGLLRDLRLDFEVYPSHLTPEHLEFLSYLRSARIGIGVQSLDPSLLKSLERPTKLDRLTSIIETLAARAEVHLEIILGLPGDTPASFRRTLDTLRQYPFPIRVYRCLVLPDALMTRPPAGANIDFDPMTLRMLSCTGWSPQDLAAEARYVSDLSTTRDRVRNADNSWWLISPDSQRAQLAAWGDGLTPRPAANVVSAGGSAVLTAEVPQAWSAAATSRDAAGASSFSLPEEVSAALAARIATAGWRLEGLEPHSDWYEISVSTADGPMQLRVQPSKSARQFFHQHDGVSVSYLAADGAVPPAQLERLRRLVESGSDELKRVMHYCEFESSDGDTEPEQPRA